VKSISSRKSRDQVQVAQATSNTPPVSVASEGGWTAYHADNFSFIQDASIDLIVTDPPFNIARDTNFHTYEGNTINSYRFDRDKGWDSHTRGDFVALLGEWASEFSRVLREGGSFAIFCADQYVSYLYHSLEDAGLSPRRTVTWTKPNAVPVNRSVMMMSSCEFIVTGVKGRNAVFNADIDGGDQVLTKHIGSTLVADKVSNIVELAVRKSLQSCPAGSQVNPQEVADLVERSILEITPHLRERVTKMFRERDGQKVLEGCVPNAIKFNSKAGNRLHPTEKPVPVLSFLIALLSNKDEVVLDPFSGSASTGEAALDLGRQVVLVERDIEFFDSGVRRLQEHSKQGMLDFE
jgi:DNA modification methylase